MSVLTTLEVQTKDLMIETFTAALRLDPMLEQLRPEIIVERAPEQMALMLRAVLRVPAEVVQDKEVARWPDGWWEALKWACRGWLPWKLRVRFRFVTLRELLLYPTVPIPHEYASHVRLRWVTSEGLTGPE